MSGRATADVVFCIDTSGSMGPCIEGVKGHISTFVDTLTAEGQGSWDLRLDFLAHRAGDDIFEMSSVFEANVPIALYGRQAGRFFTSDMGEFQNALSKLTTYADESPLIALDTALDYPWRDKSGCHRIVVLLTDEAVETGQNVAETLSLVASLIRKVMDLRVLLFMVTPESAGFATLAEADRAEWEVVKGGDGLHSVDFRKLLSQLAKSISKSQASQTPPPPVKRALYGQDRWVATADAPKGRG